MKKELLFLISLSLLFILVACNNDEEIQSDIESGTSDEEYEGVVNPQIDVIYKLTDEEIEQGIAPLEMDPFMGESEVEESEVEDDDEDEDGEDDEDEEDESPKPNI